MTPDEFIKNIKQAVHDSAVSSIVKTLEQPGGRTPPHKLRALSLWYSDLSEKDKEMVLEVIRHSVHSSVFGFLCVMDGVRTVGNGDFELFFVDENQERHPLNDFAGAKEDYLHDIYQGEVWNEVFE